MRKCEAQSNLIQTHSKAISKRKLIQFNRTSKFNCQINKKQGLLNSVTFLSRISQIDKFHSKQSDSRFQKGNYNIKYDILQNNKPGSKLVVYDVESKMMEATKSQSQNSGNYFGKFQDKKIDKAMKQEREIFKKYLMSNQTRGKKELHEPALYRSDPFKFYMPHKKTDKCKKLMSFIQLIIIRLLALQIFYYLSVYLMSNQRIISTSKTLLMFPYEADLRQKKLLHFYLTPLVQMRTFDLFKYGVKPLQLPLKLNSLSSNYIFETMGIKTLQMGSPRQQQAFSRIIILNTRNQSNARQIVLVNKKREALLAFFQQMGEDKKMYDIYLNKANHFVPDQELIRHLSYSFKGNQKTPDSIQIQNIKNSRVKYSGNFDRLDFLQSLHSALFPYNHKAWSKIMQQQMQDQLPKSAHSIEKSYLQIQFYCLYRLHYSKNRLNLYLDMKDFLSTNQKFNFLQFYQHTQADEFRLNRIIQRFLRSLKWRTAQSLQMLLHIRRSFGRNQFFILIETFLECYETIFSKMTQKMSQQQLQRQATQSVRETWDK